MSAPEALESEQGGTSLPRRPAETATASEPDTVTPVIPASRAISTKWGLVTVGETGREGSQAAMLPDTHAASSTGRYRCATEIHRGADGTGRASGSTGPSVEQRREKSDLRQSFPAESVLSLDRNSPQPNSHEKRLPVGTIVPPRGNHL